MGIGSMLKRSVLVGLGVLGIGKKKADVVVQEVAKQTAAAEKEGAIVARELVKETKKQSDKLQDAVGVHVEVTVKKRKTKKKKGKKKGG